MINELTHKDDERVALNSYRYAWTVISNIFVYTTASVLLGIHSKNNETNITPADAHIFRTLTLIVVGTGLLCMIIFHMGLRESEQPAEEREDRVQLSTSANGRLRRMTWKKFLREKEFYQCALIWMCTRVTLNVTQVSSSFNPTMKKTFIFLFLQVFLPLYVIDSISTINRVFVALAPLSSYISGLIASFPMRAINQRLGRKPTLIIGLIFILASTILFWFMYQFRTNLQLEIALISACILLGIGTSTTNICSFSLTSDLIGLNTECGAFVYGIMSFTDKLANGIVIAVIQQFNPCTSTSSAICSSYYRYILTFIPVGVSVVTIIMIVSIWNRTIGGNRQERLLENEETQSGNVVVNAEGPEYNERSSLLS